MPEHASPSAALAVVSVVIPVFNAAKYLDECLASVLSQRGAGIYFMIEVSAYDDGSEDDSWGALQRWKATFNEAHGFIGCVVSRGKESKGAGFARNCAIAQSSGEFLCTVDADDVCLPGRIAAQLEACRSRGPADLIVGAGFSRVPEGSTWHYTAWQTISQMSSWYCSSIAR